MLLKTKVKKLNQTLLYLAEDRWKWRKWWHRRGKPLRISCYQSVWTRGPCICWTLVHSLQKGGVTWKMSHCCNKTSRSQWVISLALNWTYIKDALISSIVIICFVFTFVTYKLHCNWLQIYFEIFLLSYYWSKQSTLGLVFM